MRMNKEKEANVFGMVFKMKELKKFNMIFVC